MPIYEYRCAKCGEVSEFLVLGKQKQLRCIRCGGEELIKLVSTPNLAGSSTRGSDGSRSGGCCGSHDSCGTPGSCCSG